MTADAVTVRMPAGQLLLTVQGDRLRIIRADPEILISGEMLDEILAGRHHPDGTVTRQGPDSVVGAVLTIRAVNQTAVYVIGDREQWDRDHPGCPSLFQLDCWPARWPD